MRALAVGIAIATASPAAADISAVAERGGDVRQAILVGPSGQVWEPDGAGTWKRTTHGGVAADVGGAVVADDLVVSGKATPLYRRDGTLWHTLRLGDRGRTTIGDGPRPSLAIGRQVYVWNGKRWLRVGKAAQVVTAVWASSPGRVFIATDGGVKRLAGGNFVDQVAEVISRFGGSSPWAITPAGALIDVGARRTIEPDPDGQALPVSQFDVSDDGSVWVLGRGASGWVLARRGKGTTRWQTVEAPPLAPADQPVALEIDRDGRVLVVTRAGDVHLRTGDQWSQAALIDTPPAPHTGPGPARAP